MKEIKRVEIDHKGLPFFDDKGVYVFFEDYGALQQRLDAMLAENVALKEANHIATRILNDEETMVTSLWASSVQKVDVPTPATDAIFNEVRAEAELEGMVRGAGRVALEASRVYRDAPNRSEERSLHKRIGNFAHMIARRIRAEGAIHD